jgi:hypothetical protein
VVLGYIYVKCYCITKRAKSPVTPETISLPVACPHTYHSPVRRHAHPIAICGWAFDNGDFRYCTWGVAGGEGKGFGPS